MDIKVIPDLRNMLEFSFFFFKKKSKCDRSGSEKVGAEREREKILTGEDRDASFSRVIVVSNNPIRSCEPSLS